MHVNASTKSTKIAIGSLKGNKFNNLYINNQDNTYEEIDYTMSEDKDSMSAVDMARKAQYGKKILDFKEYLEQTKIDLNNQIKNLEDNKEKGSLKNDYNIICSLLANVEYELDLYPFTSYKETKEYKDYVSNYNCKKDNIDYSFLKECNYDVTLYMIGEEENKDKYFNGTLDRLALIEYILENNHIKLEELSNYTGLISNNVYTGLDNNLLIYYKYMTEDERMLYHYLFDTKGLIEANEYLSILENKINQAYGVELANEFLNNLDVNDKGKLKENLSNMFDVSVQGLDDGISNFFSGIENVFVNNEKISAEDYKKMIILQTLTEETKYLELSYKFNTSLGNMVPSMVTSAIVSFLGSPVSGTKVASILMGTSAYGNAKYQALTTGNDILSSSIYGLLVGTSEATLGYFLGKMPGLSETSGLTLKNLLSEGVEEFSQEWLDAGFKSVILGEDTNLSDLSSQSVESFFIGVLMCGFINGGESIIDLTIDGIKYQIDTHKTLEYIKSNPNISVVEAVENVNSDVKRVELNKIESTNINSNSEKEINDLNMIFEENKFKYTHLGSEFVENLENMNNILCNVSDVEFQQNINELCKKSNSYIYNSLISFHELKNYIFKNKINVNSTINSRLKTLNNIYEGIINQQRNVLLKYSTNGADQGIVRRLALNPNSNKVLYDSLEEIVLKYFPNMSKSNINKFLRGMDETGLCTYATFIDELCINFDGKEEQFRNQFGFELYRIENGQKKINDEVLLTDLYCYFNKQNYLVVNNVEDGYEVFNDENANGVSNFGYKNKEMINSWLKSKGIELTWESQTPFYWVPKLSADIVKKRNLPIKTILNRIEYALSLGHTVEIDIMSVKDAPAVYTLYSTNNTVSDYVMDDSGDSGNQHAGGHSMMITKILGNGNLVVASWTKEYIIKINEIINRNFSIHESWLSE